MTSKADESLGGLYADLGTSRDADPSELAAAHRASVMRTHPDRGGDREEFERVTRAWMVLRDPVKRARYDATGEVEDGPDNAASVLTALLVQAFDAALAQCGGRFEYVDIVASMKRHLQSEMDKIDRQKLDVETAHKRLSKSVAKMRFKGKGSDLLGAVLKQRLRECDNAILQAKVRRSELESAAARLDDYGWDFEPPPMQRPFGFATPPGGVYSVDETMMSDLIKFAQRSS